MERATWSILIAMCHVIDIACTTWQIPDVYVWLIPDVPCGKLIPNTRWTMCLKPDVPRAANRMRTLCRVTNHGWFAWPL